jgi:hypothetical protein
MERVSLYGEQAKKGISEQVMVTAHA